MTHGGSLLRGERMKPLSRRYTSHTETNARRSGRFPFDVPYLPSRSVWQLVELAKPLYFSDRVFVKLAYDVQRGDVPDALLASLFPLRGQQIRFSIAEFRQELLKLLGAADFAKHEARLTRYCRECATISAEWTTERAEAHLQEMDMLKRRASASDRLWVAWKQAESRGKPLTESQLRQWARLEQLEQMLTPPMWIEHQARLRRVPAIQLWAQNLERRGTSLEEVRQSHLSLLKQLRTT